MDTLAVLPPPMREALTPHVSAILAGVVEPDFYRVVSHKTPIISLRGTPPPPRSEAADALKRLATNAQEMLRLGRSLGGLLFVQGQATHFVQDFNQPLHAAWGETRAEHNEVEAQMLYRSWQKDHTYRGFMLVKNYSCFAYEIARIPRNMRRRSSLTGRSSESLRSRGTRPSMTRQTSGNRSSGTSWGRSGRGSCTGSRRR